MSDEMNLIKLILSSGNIDKERLAKRIQEVKRDKIGLLSTAETYSEKYNEEVLEGTKKKMLLLSYGERAGLTEKEVMEAYGKFLPTVQTPILNMLFFMQREVPEPDWNEIRKEFFAKFGHEFDGLDADALNKKYGDLQWDSDSPSEVKEPNDMMQYVFEKSEITLDIFNKIKKLKALSRKGQEEEAFLAYKACLKLCEKYNLDFDKVPCNL